MITYQEAQADISCRQGYLEELIKTQDQNLPYVSKVIYDHKGHELFNYAKTLFPNSQDGEIRLFLRDKGSRSAFQVLNRFEDYGKNQPSPVYVKSDAFALTEAEFLSQLVDHEFEHCRLQYKGISFPGLNINLSPLTDTFVSPDGVRIIEELLAYANEYKGLEKWDLNIASKKKDILVYMTDYIIKLRNSPYSLHPLVIDTGREIIGDFLYYLKGQIPDAFKVEVKEQVVEPKSLGSLIKGFLKR